METAYRGVATEAMPEYGDCSSSGLDAGMPELETWDNQYPGRDYTIRFSFPEFTAICPKTGLPDFADLQITYTPDRHCVELKSLKFYLLAYRTVGIFHENVVNRVLDDLVRTLRPMKLTVTGDFNPRGGIHTVVSASYAAPVG